MGAHVGKDKAKYLSRSVLPAFKYQNGEWINVDVKYNTRVDALSDSEYSVSSKAYSKSVNSSHNSSTHSELSATASAALGQWNLYSQIKAIPACNPNNDVEMTLENKDQSMPTEMSFPTVIDVESISVLTWNVWFDKFQFRRRCQEILRIAGETQADVMCFQEVLPAFVDLMVREPWVQEHYYVSDISGETVYPYGVLMLSRIPVKCFHRIDYPKSKMNRKLLLAEFEVAKLVDENNTVSESVFISTSHLESMHDKTQTRISQLKFTFEILSLAPHVVFMGDFNFCGDWPENSHIPKDYADLWIRLQDTTVDPGYTMADFGPFPAWRPDRILVKSAAIGGNIGLAPVSIQRIGTEPIAYENLSEDERYSNALTPSDHNGLLAVIKVCN